MVGVSDAMGEFVQECELRRSSVSHDDHVSIHHGETEQSPWHRASDDERRVDVFAVGYPLDPALCVGEREPKSRPRHLERLLSTRHSFGVGAIHKALAHCVIVAI